MCKEPEISTLYSVKPTLLAVHIASVPNNLTGTTAENRHYIEGPLVYGTICGHQETHPGSIPGFPRRTDKLLG